MPPKFPLNVIVAKQRISISINFYRLCERNSSFTSFSGWTADDDLIDLKGHLQQTLNCGIYLCLLWPLLLYLFFCCNHQSMLLFWEQQSICFHLYFFVSLRKGFFQSSVSIDTKKLSYVVVASLGKSMICIVCAFWLLRIFFLIKSSA